MERTGIRGGLAMLVHRRTHGPRFKDDMPPCNGGFTSLKKKATLSVIGRKWRLLDRFSQPVLLEIWVSRDIVLHGGMVVVGVPETVTLNMIAVLLQAFRSEEVQMHPNKAPGLDASTLRLQAVSYAEEFIEASKTQDSSQGAVLDYLGELLAKYCEDLKYRGDQLHQAALSLIHALQFALEAGFQKLVVEFTDAQLGNKAAKMLAGYSKENKEPPVWLEEGPAFLLPIEKEGGRRGSTSAPNFLKEILFDLGAVDLSFAGNKFTWFNKRLGLSVLSKIGLGIQDAELLFKNPGIKRSGDRVVSSCSENNMAPDSSSKWNKEAFGNCQGRIKTLTLHIQEIQKKEATENNCKIEARLQQELNEWLLRNETLWRQKSREVWLREGDRNSKFFHISTIIQRKKNTIEALKSDQGSWITEAKEIKKHLSSKFNELFKEDEVEFPADLHNLITPNISVEDNDDLCKIPSTEEINAALFDVVKAISSFFHSSKMFKEVNESLIVLIPKVPIPTTANNYRPIGLCNVVCKIIAKLLVDKLRPFLQRLISHCQSAFIPSRWIAENEVIVQELLHSFKQRKVKVGVMAQTAEATILTEWLEKYCSWSGQLINRNKSGVFFSKHTKKPMQRSLKCLLQMKAIQKDSFYLGSPMFLRAAKTKDFHFLLDKVEFKLKGWRSKSLSWARRTTLIKSVAQALPTYTMSTFEVPTTIWTKIDSATRRFWWNLKTSSGSHLALKSWEALCLPHKQGGLGFRKRKEFKMALVSKMAWMVITNRHNSCMDLLRSACFQVGDGKSINVWKDPWIPWLTGFKPKPKNQSISLNPLMVSSLINFNTKSWKTDQLIELFDEESSPRFCYTSQVLSLRNKALIQELSKPAPGSKELHFTTQYSQSFFTQCMACLWKQHWSYWRNPPYTAVRFLFTVFISLIFGTMFWDLGSKIKRQQDLFNAMGSMYAAVIFLGVQNSSSVQPVVAVERTVFYRERAAGMYSALPYAFAQVAIELPYVFAQAAVYGIIVYAMIGFEWTVAKFFWYLFIMYFTLLYFTFFGMMTVAVTPNHHIASIISAAFYGIWNLFSGFIVPRPRIPIWWIWYYWACPMAWTLYGLLVSQFGDIKDRLEDSDETVEEFVSRYFGFKHDFLGVVAVVVAGIAVFFAFIFAVSIKVFNFQRR
uniref:ABC-2 type transporter transmembrane domain-containing protein n=1 Tax=Fagus sylvatica TaxID=28930 RepID=A0A2N9HY11_FAGSY